MKHGEQNLPCNIASSSLIDMADIEETLRECDIVLVKMVRWAVLLFKVI